MLHIITGGSGSGKSAYAEELIVSFAAAKRIYIATMYPADEECRKKIARHRRLRAEKDFETVECYKSLGKLTLPENAAVLLECMSNLAANEVFGGNEMLVDCAEGIVQDVLKLAGRVQEMVVVTNEVFSDGNTYDEGTRHYLRQLGQINREVAAQAKTVTEVVYGIPVRVGAI